jgi:hypothetical protein
MKKIFNKIKVVKSKRKKKKKVSSIKGADLTGCVYVEE